MDDIRTERAAPAKTDAELLTRFVDSSDQTAFEELVRRHSTMVIGLCRRMLSDQGDVEDVFQAAFLVLAKNARKIHKRASVASWLYGVTYRVALKTARARYRRRETDLEHPIVEDQSPLENVARRHEQRIVDEELQGLPEATRLPMVLHYFSGRSSPEIARELGMSVSAVEGRLKRGRQELRRRLTGRGIAPGVLAAVALASMPTERVSASEALIESVVEQGMTFANTGGGEGSAVELAREEVVEMAMVGKKLLVACSACVVVAGMGITGVLSQLHGQDAFGGAGDSTAANELTVTAAQDPFQDDTSADVTISDIAVANGDIAGAVGSSFGSTAPASRLSIERQAVADIEEMLFETKHQFSFFESPLNEFADFLSASLGIPVMIEERALEEIGMSPDVPIRNLPELNVSPASAMRLALEPLDLTYVIEDEVLKITSIEEAEMSPDVRIYPLEMFGATEADTDDLVNVITSSVDPESWEEVGGPSSISVFQSRLVVSTTFDTHAKIRDLAHQLVSTK